MIIGLTGQFGSGKSTVAAVFEEMGARVVSADEIGREVVESNPTIMYRLVLDFGPSIVTSNGKLDRRALGKITFSSPNATQKLNEIVHPALLSRLDCAIQSARMKRTDLVVDAALLIYWNYQNKMDATILVTASESKKIQRLSNRGFSKQEYRERTRNQLPESILRKNSDYILSNNSTLAQLRRMAKKLYQQLAEIG